LCGMLLPLVRSRQNPYTNLRNQVTEWTRFSHLQFKDVYSKIFGEITEKTRIYNESRVFSLENVEEELYSPSRKYCMNQTEMRRLRAYYITMLERRANDLGVRFGFILCYLVKHLIPNTFKDYYKFCTEIWKTTDEEWAYN